VTTIEIVSSTSTSGRASATQRGAMPKRGRKRGISCSRPAIAEAPARPRISIVATS
jgi:hypothetical protein